MKAGNGGAASPPLDPQATQNCLLISAQAGQSVAPISFPLSKLATTRYGAFAELLP